MKPGEINITKITLRKFSHNTHIRIGLYFESFALLNKLAKQMGAKWSSTFKCWHVPYNKTNYQLILKAFKGYEIVIEKDDDVSSSINSRAYSGNPSSILPRSIRVAKKAVNPSPVRPVFSDNNMIELDRFVKMLALKGYSSSTQKTYKNEFSVFLQLIKSVDVQLMTTERLTAYFFYCYKHLKLSENTIHSRLNALKFYYEQVLMREKFFWDIPRPKKHLILPKVISEEKIIAGITEMANLKHKALLAIAYSAGLRVSEVVRLKITDINSDRMQIFIGKAKGKKDRMVTLSSFALKILREYYVLYKPSVWLFEGIENGQHYSSRSAQETFKGAYKKLGLPSTMSFHSLRHSFATHLLENGTDIKYIQELLGHNDIHTTLRYTHVSKKAIGNVESPLDKIARKMGL